MNCLINLPINFESEKLISLLFPIHLHTQCLWHNATSMCIYQQETDQLQTRTSMGGLKQTIWSCNYHRLVNFSHPFIKHGLPFDHIHLLLYTKLIFIFQQHMFISMKQDDWAFHKGNISFLVALLYFCFLQNSLSYALSSEMTEDCTCDCFAASQ